MRKLAAFFKTYGQASAPLYCIAGLFLLLSVLSLAQPEVLRRATEAIAQVQGQAAIVELVLFAVISAALFISAGFIKDIYTRKTKNSYERGISKRLLETLFATRMSRLDKKQFGDISTVVIRNTERFVDTAVGAISNGVSGYASVLITFIYMCAVQWQIAVCVLVYNAVIRFFAVFVERKIKQNSSEATQAVRESGNFLSALLRNMLLVRLYSNRDFFRSRLRKNEAQVKGRNWTSFIWSNGFQDFIWAFSKLAEFVIVYGVGAILIAGELSDISVLLTFVFANDLFTIGINNISYSLQLKAEAQTYQASLEEVLRESEMDSEPHTPIQAPHFDIRFHDVCFGYEGEELLHNVSFTIRQGEKVLLKGPNGQGKSTILKLISGLYRPRSGSVWFGETDIGTVNLDTLTRCYGYISQHTHLLAGTVSQNLALSETIDIEPATDVLQVLGLAHCTDTNPQTLSMGEKQRLNIGRTLYRGNLPLLLCDEIFANIDKENRAGVARLLSERYSDATILMISHEDIGFSFDRVLTVSDGRISEVEA